MIEPETLRKIREGWLVVTTVVDCVFDGVERYATKKPTITTTGRVIPGISQADMDTYLHVRKQLESGAAKAPNTESS